MKFLLFQFATGFLKSSNPDVADSLLALKNWYEMNLES